MNVSCLQEEKPVVEVKKGNSSAGSLTAYNPTSSVCSDSQIDTASKEVVLCSLSLFTI